MKRKNKKKISLQPAAAGYSRKYHNHRLGELSNCCLICLFAQKRAELNLFLLRNFNRHHSHTAKQIFEQLAHSQLARRNSYGYRYSYSNNYNSNYV